MKMATFLLSLSALAVALSSATFAAPAEELALVCVPKGDPLGGSRTVLIGESHENVALTDSRGHRVETNRYAVLIELVPGRVAREEWEILERNEFRVRKLDSLNYSFRDLRHRVDYVCSVEQEVRANPALTRTN